MPGKTSIRFSNRIFHSRRLPESCARVRRRHRSPKSPEQADSTSLSQIPRSLDHRVYVCAIGLRPESERVLRFASQGAAAAGAKLSLIHVTHNGAEKNARQRLDELQKAVGSAAEVRIAVGPVKKALLDAVRQSAPRAVRPPTACRSR